MKTTKSFRVLHKNYLRLYGSKFWFGSFVNAKPFYIKRPTISDNLPELLSEYLCKNLICPREYETNCYKLDCILAKCENKCGIVNTFNKLEDELIKSSDNILNYYTFEKVEGSYFNKKAEKPVYSKTARVDKEEVATSIANHLQSPALNNIIDRFLSLMAHFTGIHPYRILIFTTWDLIIHKTLN